MSQGTGRNRVLLLLSSYIQVERPMEAINLMLDQSKGEFRKTETLESFPKTLNIRKVL